MLLVYFYGYKYISSIKGIFTYTNTMIAYYITNKQDITNYLSIFNSAYVISTFMFILAGH